MIKSKVFVNSFGSIVWNNTKQRYHRGDDKPAVICYDGVMGWYQNGVLHRDGDKPAFITSLGAFLYFKEGIEYDPIK